jgi:hypothetical protein
MNILDIAHKGNTFSGKIVRLFNSVQEVGGLNPLAPGFTRRKPE